MGCWRRGRVGATTLQASACKAEQHPRTRCQWLNRVRSALTQTANCVEAKKVNTHKNLLRNQSDQLRNLGSQVLPLVKPRIQQYASTPSSRLRNVNCVPLLTLSRSMLRPSRRSGKSPANVRCWSGHDGQSSALTSPSRHPYVSQECSVNCD